MIWILLVFSLLLSFSDARRWPNAADLDRIEEILPAFSALRHVEDPLDKFNNVSLRFRNAFAPIAIYIRDGFFKIKTDEAKRAVLEAPRMFFSADGKPNQAGDVIYDMVESRVLALPDASRTELIASYMEFFQILKERKKAIEKPFLLDNYVETYTKSTIGGFSIVSLITLLLVTIFH